MAFEMHVKKNRRLPEGYLKINYNYVTFPIGATKNLKGKNVEIYLDYKNKKMGFLPSNDNIKGFKVGKKGEFASGIIPFVHKDQSINGLYKYAKEKDMFVIKVKNLNREGLF